jgi:hypothetical protein
MDIPEFCQAIKVIVCILTEREIEILVQRDHIALCAAGTPKTVKASVLQINRKCPPVLPPFDSCPAVRT